MFRAVFAVGAAAAIMGVALTTQGSVAAATHHQITVARGGPREIAAAPGDMVVYEGAGAEVPQQGHGVFASMLTTHGSIDLHVWTTKDGGVFVDPTLIGPGDPGGGLPDCSDSNEPPALGFGPWQSTFLWYFHSSSTPSGMNVANVETDLKSAVNNILNENNFCSRPDTVTTTSSYGGRVALGTNIDNNGHCLSGDGTSMVGFGSFPSGVLAGTCVWTSGATPVESDMRMASAQPWITDEGSGCKTAFNVDDVATHERGHTFDMNDVTSSSHSEQTMYYEAFSCETQKETLTLGDMLRLEAQNN